MKHPVYAVILILMGTLSWAQEAKAPFDIRKSREELEITKGILNTTMTFVLQNSQKERQRSRWRFADIDAFHLAGQGAVFIIPTSEFRIPGMNNISFNWSPGFSEEISEYSEAVAREAMRTAQNALQNAWFDDEDSPGAAPVPPVPPAPSASDRKNKQESSEGDREELRRRIEEVRAKMKKNQEQAEATRQAFLQRLSEVKDHLVEVLANYGDTMTTVKPDEYINLVLVTEQSGNQGDRTDVISARKSWIVDYKGGRLTLEAFKQRVVQYNQ